MKPTRREFLVQTLGSTTLLASGLSLPGFLRQTALAATPARGGRVLVIVQLTGGNDGLNTVIPYEDDAYHRARPTLRIAAERVLKLDRGLGLHPDMVGMKRLYDEGLLGVVTNVGYPNPDRSHFRSMDIWHTARLDPEQAREGWLGRAASRVGGQSGAPPALHLDDDALPLALHAEQLPIPSVRSLAALRLENAAEIERALQAVAAAPGGRSAVQDDLLFVRRTAVSSCANAARIAAIAQPEGRQAAYAEYGLAQRLKQIAQLIAADFGARVYYTSLGGFDTHARQALAHGPLLRELSESTASFFADLRGRGLADRVLLMTFSEFGRRVSENGSQGTDHGAAAPLLLAGPACRGGVIGEPPVLGALDDGDVRHRVDFRQVYAALLDQWLETPASEILGERFSPLPVLRA